MEELLDEINRFAGYIMRDAKGQTHLHAMQIQTLVVQAKQRLDDDELSRRAEAEYRDFMNRE